ncbi:MAG TPA: PASTA domain-containing protein [Terriglobales bacterium]|nr:PASTA domain-containing protein [Terriglobales bacterium]
MRSFFRLALLALILLTIALISALTAMRVAIHGREVVVPRLVGLSPAEAERVALESGLLVEIENRFYSATVSAGRILSQLPQEGATVRRGWKVRLAQSLGPQHIAIPNVVGASLRAAELNLQRRGLEAGNIAYMRMPNVPAGQVIAQTPLPDAIGVASPRVNLLVADDPEPPQQPEAPPQPKTMPEPPAAPPVP